MKIKTNNFKRRLLTMCFLISYSLVLHCSYGQVTVEQDQDMGVDALHFWYSDPNKPVALFNRNISPKGDCITIVNDYIFFAWYKGGMTNRNLMLSRRKLGSNNWVTIQFPEKNTLYTATYQGINYANSPGGDSHRTAAVGVSSIDGTIHIMHDTHSDELNYRLSKKNIAFAPDSEFKLSNFLAERNYINPGQPLNSFTYPGFETNDAGELILKYRVGGTRKGNMMIAYYDGSNWSPNTIMVNGREANPTFNTYGEVQYMNGKLYLGGAIRVAGSPIEFNQGIYFAEGGQRGTSSWKSYTGTTKPVPLLSLAPFKIGEPLPNGHNGMTGSPTFAVTESGAVHFSVLVNGNGRKYYYKTAGASNFTASNGGKPISFAAGNKVYSTEISGGNIKISSTPEGQNNWTTDLVYNAPGSFALMSFEYYQGKLYIVASREIESDKRPLHHIVIDLDVPVDDVTPVLTLSSGNTTVNPGYNFSLSATANIPSSEISNMRLYIDNQFVRQENVAPYEWGFAAQGTENDLNGLPVGNHQIKVVAMRSNGTTFEKTITLTVNNPTPAPVLTLSAGNTTVNPGYSFSLSATANISTTDIDNMKLYIDNQFVRQENVTPYTWGFSGSFSSELENLPIGNHQIKVVAITNAGISFEKSLTLTVVDDSNGDDNSETCYLKIIPGSSDWVFGNDWNDQDNGSLVYNAQQSLKVRHRPWGQDHFFLILEDQPFTINNGDSYSVAIDLLASNNVTSIQVGMASGISNNKPSGYVIPLKTLSSGYSAENYVVKSVNLAANTSDQTAYFVIKVNLNRSGSNQYYQFKNLNICSNGQPLFRTFENDEEALTNNEFKTKLFPVPSFEVLNIKRSTNEPYEIKIFNSFGREVFNQKMSNKNEQITVTDYDDGMYFAKIVSGKSVETIPFIIEK